MGTLFLSAGNSLLRLCNKSGHLLRFPYRAVDQPTVFFPGLIASFLDKAMPWNALCPAHGVYGRMVGTLLLTKL
jgi:hypothetical protein